MSVLFSDAFTRADNTALGANWNEAVPNTGDFTIVSNALRMAIGAAGPSILLTTTSAHAAIADCKVTVTQNATGGDGGPVLRVATASGTPKMYVADCFGTEVDVARHDTAAGSTLLQANTSVTKAANGVIALQASGTGATVALTSWYQGAQLGAVFNDTSASRIVSSNQCGIHNWNSAGTTVLDYDDFQVEDLAAGATTAQEIPIFDQALSGQWIGQSWDR